MIWVIPFVVLGVLLVHSHKEREKFKKWAEADTLRNDLFNKYLELCEDPSMTDAKWREWAKVFRYVDAYYEANNYLGVEMNRLADFAEQWID